MNTLIQVRDCQIRQPDRGEADADPCPGLQPVVGLGVCSQLTHAQTYKHHIRTHTRTHRQPVAESSTLSTHTSTHSTCSLRHPPEFTHAVAHPLQLLPSWARGPLSPGPHPGAALRAPDPHTHTHLHTRALLPGKESAVEFNERTGHAALTRYRTWPAKSSNQLTA